jgi:hypothetical protein
MLNLMYKIIKISIVIWQSSHNIFGFSPHSHPIYVTLLTSLKSLKLTNLSFTDLFSQNVSYCITMQKLKLKQLKDEVFPVLN